MLDRYDPITRRLAIEMVQNNGWSVTEALTAEIQAATETSVTSATIRRWVKGYRDDINNDYNDLSSGRHRRDKRNDVASAPSIDTHDVDEFDAITDDIERIELLIRKYMNLLAEPISVMEAPEKAIRAARVVEILSRERDRRNKLPQKVLEKLPTLLALLDRHGMRPEVFFDGMIATLSESMTRPQIVAPVDDTVVIELNEVDDDIIDLDVDINAD